MPPPASPRVLHRRRTQTVGLAGGNSTSQLHQFVVIRQSQEQPQAPGDSYFKQKSECSVSLRCRPHLLQNGFLRGAQGMPSSEMDARYQSVSALPARTPGGQSASLPAWAGIKDLSALLGADSPSSFGRAGFVCHADRPHDCSKLFLHSCGSAILHIPHLWNHAAVRQGPGSLSSCGVPLTPECGKRSFFCRAFTFRCPHSHRHY